MRETQDTPRGKKKGSTSIVKKIKTKTETLRGQTQPSVKP